METFIVTLVAFAGVVAVMAIGVALTGRSLRGSCGGVGGSKSCACSATEREVCRARASAGSS